MSDIKNFRIQLVEHLKNNHLLNQLTQSVTIVGSFYTKNDISAFSDIDTIVIVQKLNKFVYDQIIEVFKSISLEKFGLSGYQVIVNPTFGPLKFNQEKTLVFHVMIYDILGHRKHVIDSPFTCYEWQQHGSIVGKKLYEIYPSNALSLMDISASRRGFLSYREDLQNGALTYRAYQFINDEIIEEKKLFVLDKRHQYEYAYHILKFLMKNIFSIVYQKHIFLDDDDLVNQFSDFDSSFQSLPKLYNTLGDIKSNSGKYQEGLLSRVQEQVHLISLWFERFHNNLPLIYFYRHLSTDLNDGRFLGSLSDPDINNSIIAKDSSIEICYTSTLKRTKSTANLLSSCQKIETPLLNEMNYGKAEGMTYEELKSNFGEIIEAWEQHIDIRFPGGESLEDVNKRLDLFVEENIGNSEHKVIGVVTHNVVIRVLLAKFYSIPLTRCYKFQIRHAEKIACRYWNGSLIPELTNEQRIRYRDQYHVWTEQ